MNYFLDGKVIHKDAIYDELLTLKLPADQKIKSELVQIFNITEDNKVRDKIALIFADLADPSVIPVLINKIKEIKYSRHISTLIYACSEYDCGEWIDFFVSLAIDLDDSSYLEAISVLEEMRKPIRLSEKIVCAKRLTDYLSSMPPKTQKHEDVEGVLELVESMETVR